MEPVVEAGKGGKITGIPEGDQFFTASTPQAFKSDVLHKALAHASKKKLKLVDEVAAARAIKQDVNVVPLKRPLIRIGSPIDLNLAEFYLRH